MPYKYVRGDLLEATTEYIVQQNNCTGIKAAGLSESISKKWPGINIYSERRKGKGNTCVKEDESGPGTIFLYEFEDTKDDELKGVICAFAQVTPGKQNPEQNDSAKERQQYFLECLEQILLLEPKSVGFPYKIGCGLAGGNWLIYEKMIQDWSKRNPEIDVVIYQM